MCKRFEDGLNEEIGLLVGILELKSLSFYLTELVKPKSFAKRKERPILRLETLE